jgi:hypothetical protein
MFSNTILLQPTTLYHSSGKGVKASSGPLYLLMGDVEGAIKSCEWVEQTFPDDLGEPVHFPC